MRARAANSEISWFVANFHLSTEPTFISSVTADDVDRAHRSGVALHCAPAHDRSVRRDARGDHARARVRARVRVERLPRAPPPRARRSPSAPPNPAAAVEAVAEVAAVAAAEAVAAAAATPGDSAP